LASTHGIKGTILLAPEGINLFICAKRAVAFEFLSQLRSLDPALAGLKSRETSTDRNTFKRLKVKIKPEIIRYEVPQAVPLGQRAPAVTPAQLRHWIDQGHDDQGRPLVLLDTRNDFEVDQGSFSGAIDWRIQKFTDLADHIAQNKQSFEGKTVVSFCTGGIRCEKSVLHMQALGYESAYQLEGGVLGYFEHEGKTHWQGELFVFDDRRGVTEAHSRPSEASVSRP
jgi:UPF0176 protein